MERGDTGLGRDAYGLPRRERDRRGYGPGPYPSDDGYSPSEYEEDDAAGSGRPVDVEEDDYGQLLRRPGEMPPRQQRLRQPGRPHPGQPGRFPPGRPVLRQTAVLRTAAPRAQDRATAAYPATATACPAVARPATACPGIGAAWRTSGNRRAARWVSRWRHAPRARAARRPPARRPPARQPPARQPAQGGVPHGAPPNGGPGPAAPCPVAGR